MDTRAVGLAIALLSGFSFGTGGQVLGGLLVVAAIALIRWAEPEAAA